ncbi:MAG: TonB-dependent receptor [Pseudomonadota bacterium]
MVDHKMTRLRARLSVGVAVLALSSGIAYAQSVNLSLPEQPLSISLKAVAERTGKNILFTSDSVSGMRAQALNGQMTGQQAVNNLLRGTNLVAVPDGSDGLVVRVAETLPARAVTAAPTDAAKGADDTGETIVVSASRINVAGYQQPTPVTVVGTAQLERDAHTDIGDTIRQLPSFGASSGPSNGATAINVAAGNAGEDLINLRNLGILRTLVLVDGQRVVQSNITGGVDLSTIPSSLVQRIDVVTGGASAAWGSDAVAGVVNLVLNKNFEGFKANVEGGDSWKDDHQNWKVEATWGGSFLNDRAHLIFNAQYQDSPNIIYPQQRSWYHDTQLVNNPAYTATNGQPKLIHADNVGYAQATSGGVITGNPAGTVAGSANALAGIQFVGPNGTPAPYVAGNVSGVYANGGTNDTIVGTLNPMSVNFRNVTSFGYGSYKITPDIQASFQLNYGKSVVIVPSSPAYKFGSVVIHNDNAFLDPTIQARMAALGVTSFNLGTLNVNNISTNDLSLGALENSVGIPVNQTQRTIYRGVFSLDGSLGEDWSWNGYYQHGTARVRETLLSDMVTGNFNNAVDAVRVTTANVGTSGLAVGTIACRSTLTNPANGCQPLDVFGVGVASKSAIAYVNQQNDFSQIVLNEDVASASMQGKLPWELPAGPVAVAFGGEYRKEAGVNTTSALAIAKALTVGNFAPFKGSYNVEEGFAEVNAPILKDSFVQSVDFNAAGRITSYSTSGLVETWKLGLTSQVTDDVRLRTTWSYDIRAPDLSELFAAGASTSNQGIDPHSGKNVNFFTVSVGNAALKPEQSTTISGGIVVTPHWIEGLNLSADWYSINIKGAIASTGSTTELAQCNAGNQFYCSQLVFAGPGGALSSIIVSPLNAASATTSGLDFQSDYTRSILNGVMNLRLVGNYTDEQTQTLLGITSDYAGALGGDSSPSGVPKFKATASATYIEGPWQGTLQGRYIGSARLVNTWGPLNVDDNSIPTVAYMDLRGSYRWNENVQLYMAVDNTFNTPPPVIATSSAGSTFLSPATRTDIYDAIGRQYRVGVRFSY